MGLLDRRACCRKISWIDTNQSKEDSSMSSPDDRRYTDSHEWLKPDGSTVTLGITRFAVDELTDLTFVDLPEVGQSVEAGQPIGEVESVKATSDLYTAVNGTVAEVNEAVVENPGLVNEDPFERGWLVKIEPADPSQVEQLMDASTYDGKYPLG
jgi:glycine cleavage system H protein